VLISIEEEEGGEVAAEIVVEVVVVGNFNN